MTQAYYILEQTLPFKTLEQTHSSEIELKSVEKKADRDLQTLLQEEKTTPDDVADYLVKGLKQSQQTHPRYQEAMQFLSTQKYQPRYTMVFRLVARLTSADKNGDQPLRSFWKALLSKPFDITGIGHRCLMIRCLDEAWSDERVPYKESIRGGILATLKATINAAGGKDNIFQQLGANLRQRLFAELQQTSVLGGIQELLDSLLAALKDKDWRIRAAAAQALGHIGEKAAIEPVIQALLGALKDNPGAIQALGRLGKKAATPDVVKALLRKALEDGSGHIRAAVEALGHMGEKTAIESVIQALLDGLKNEKEDAARSSIAQTLGQLGDKAATRSAIQTLLDELKNKDQHAQVRAAKALGQLGEKAATDPDVIQALLDGLKDAKWAARAAETLGQLGDKATTEPGSVIQALLEALKNKVWNVRNAAAQALGHMGEKAAILSVIQALLDISKKDKEGDVRNAAAKALGQLGNKATTEPGSVIQALLDISKKDKEGHVRAAATLALGQIGDKAATFSVIQALLETLEKDKEQNVRNAAAKSLLNLPRAAVLNNYLQSSVSLFGVNKKYAQSVAQILLQSTALVYQDQDKQLLLYDGQTCSPHKVTEDHRALVKALLESLNQQAEILGLPCAVQQAYLTDKEIFSITVTDEKTTLPTTTSSPISNSTLTTQFSTLLSSASQTPAAQPSATPQSLETKTINTKSNNIRPNFSG